LYIYIYKAYNWYIHIIYKTYTISGEETATWNGCYGTCSEQDNVAWQDGLSVLTR